MPAPQTPANRLRRPRHLDAAQSPTITAGLCRSRPRPAAPALPARATLNAIIGFSGVLSERMFGDLNEKQEEYLKDIYASGTHLLSLINDILDISTIEAGRMGLELTDFDLPTAIDNALTLVRERAGRPSITLHTAVDAGSVRCGRASERSDKPF
jgi:signal transduction histidine kinase